MQQTVPQCTNCGAYTRRSLHHEQEYQRFVLLERVRTSNFPATDEEIAHIRHTILPTVFDDISSIESKVASLHEVIRSMEEEREKLISVQKRYNHLISLHRTLPSEIWSEIFLCTLSDDSDFNAFDASGSIWQLSHVCQKWRNIALSLRSFWSTIDIQFPKAAQHDGHVQRLETVIQRSHQGLLDISLTSDGIPDMQTPNSNPSILKRILDIALAESYRWREFNLSDYQGSLNIPYASLHNRLPRLQSVGLYCAPLELEGASAMSVFKDCACLTKLTLAGGTLGVEFPWDQITELDLSCMNCDGSDERRACMHLIAICPSLEILSTPYYWDSQDADDNVYTPITCSNMRKLDCTSEPIIDALTLPHLREAYLNPEPIGAFHYNILHSFKKLLIRSSCLSTFTSLSLVGVPLTPSPEHSLLSILSQTHSLLELALTVSMQLFDDETDFSDQEQILAIMKSLEVMPTETVTFLPLLSSLSIQVSNHRDQWRLPYFGPIDSFASMLKACWEGDGAAGLARLKTCHFTVHALHLKRYNVYRDGVGGSIKHIFNEAERLIFDALVEAGMDLAIRVTSDLTDSVGSDNVVFAVPS